MTSDSSSDCLTPGSSHLSSLENDLVVRMLYLVVDLIARGNDGFLETDTCCLSSSSDPSSGEKYTMQKLTHIIHPFIATGGRFTQKEHAIFACLLLSALSSRGGDDGPGN